MDFLLKKILSNKRGEIASIVLIVGMVVVTLGVIAGGQYINTQRNTTSSEASDPITQEVVPGPWDKPGTTAFVWGQVRTVDADGNYMNEPGFNSSYWQTSKGCEGSIRNHQGLNISGNAINSCDSISRTPYFAQDLALPTLYTFKLQNIPAGYECVGWEHRLRYISPVNGQTERIKASGNGCTAGSQQMEVLFPESNYKNSHYLVFKIRNTQQLPNPDIKISKRHIGLSGNPATIVKGGDVPYVIRVQNDGGQTATNVSITELLNASSPAYTFDKGLKINYAGGASGPADATKVTTQLSPAGVVWSGFTLPVGSAVEVLFQVKASSQVNVLHQNSASVRYASVSAPSTFLTATYNGATTAGEEVKTVNPPTATPTRTPTPTWTPTPTLTNTPSPTRQALPTPIYAIRIKDTSVANNLLNDTFASTCTNGNWCTFNKNIRTRTTINQTGTLTVHSNATPNDFGSCWIQKVGAATADGSIFRLRANIQSTFGTGKVSMQIQTNTKEDYKVWYANGSTIAVDQTFPVLDADKTSRFSVKFCTWGTGTQTADATLTKISLVKLIPTPTPLPTINVRANVSGNKIVNTDGGGTCSLGKWCRTVRASSSTPLNADGSLGIVIEPTSGNYGACWIHIINGVYADGSTYRLRATFDTNNDSADPATIQLQTENKDNYISNPNLSGTSIDKTVVVRDPQDITKRISVKFCSWGTWVTKRSVSNLKSISFVKTADAPTVTPTKSPTPIPTINVRANVTGNMLTNTDGGSTCAYGQWCRYIRPGGRSGTPINPDGSIAVVSDQNTGDYGACWIQWVRNGKADGSTYRLRANFDSTYKTNGAQIQIERRNNDGLKRATWYTNGTGTLDKTISLLNDDRDYISIKFCGWGTGLPANSVASLKSISFIKTADAPTATPTKTPTPTSTKTPTPTPVQPDIQIHAVKPVNPKATNGQVATVSPGGLVQYAISVQNSNTNSQKAVNLSVEVNLVDDNRYHFVSGDSISYNSGGSGTASKEPSVKSPTASDPTMIKWTGITLPVLNASNSSVEIRFTVRASEVCDKVQNISVNVNYSPESEPSRVYSTVFDGYTQKLDDVKVSCPGTTPSATPSPTSDPLPGDTATPTPTLTASPIPDNCPLWPQGDADCEENFNSIDLVCYAHYKATEDLTTGKKGELLDGCIHVDFNSDGEVNTIDLGIWANSAATFDPNK